MIESFTAFWPKEIPILIQLDDDGLVPSINKMLRDGDGLNVGWTKEHAAFVERNKSKDDPQDYRKQAVRFCHKVFALKFACDAAMKAREAKAIDAPRYLIWLDADVLTTKPVTIEDIQKCLPKEGDAVAYLGRKDWPHSECGWLAFDLENGGGSLIDKWITCYISDEIFSYDQWHDSWAFDVVQKAYGKPATNLTSNAIGMEVWPQSPMAAWSRHYKGPIAKSELSGALPQKSQNTMRPMTVQTRNSIPDTDIQRNILENQAQIANWVRQCQLSDEKIVVVSAGPMLVAEDLRCEVEAKHKIVAVKHALEPLKAAGIKPWACILLDPREHVADFVTNPDTDIIWFVASQVSPRAVKSLLDHGCNVWGYHASVGANEGQFTEKQPDAIIHGGSATATRGLFLLEKLGFTKFKLYGYDLCVADKPDLGLKDEQGQPQFFEVSIDANMPHYKSKRAFWSKGELLAQFEEFKQTILTKSWDVEAIGHGIAPFIANAKRVSDLRGMDKKAKMPRLKTISCEDLCSHKTPLWRSWRRKP